MFFGKTNSLHILGVGYKHWFVFFEKNPNSLQAQLTGYKKQTNHLSKTQAPFHSFPVCEPQTRCPYFFAKERILAK